MTHENLYSATYSGVPVLEFIHPRSSVMRRKKDGWVNATHILKVANFPKAKRTRILERDVQTGVHEKVQGGYGKYQGTWVPLERAVQVAKQFGVYKDLQPLLEYSPVKGIEPPPAPKHHHASTNKKAARARRANTMPLMLKQDEKAVEMNGPEAAVLPAKRSRTTAGTKRRKPAKGDIIFVAPKKARRRVLKAPRGGGSGVPRTPRTPGTPQTPRSVADVSSDDSDSFPLDSDSDGTPQDNYSSQPEFLSAADLDRVLRKKRSQTRTVQAVRPDEAGEDEEDDNEGTPEKTTTQRLLEYFLTSEGNVATPLPSFVTDSHNDFDINSPIDKDGNTIFHWACAMGDLRMCQALLNRGADIRSLNNMGEVPVMRCVIYTNSYQRRTFAKILDLLRDTLLDVDSRGRTILHHIALSASCHSNLPAARYHTEILLTKVAETVQPMERIINFINQQDDEGNTALHVMSYNGARKCIRILLGYNARIDIPNGRNEYVSDYLYNGDITSAGTPGSAVPLTSAGVARSVSVPALAGLGLSQRGESFNRLLPFNGTLAHSPSAVQALLSPRPGSTPPLTGSLSAPLGASMTASFNGAPPALSVLGSTQLATPHYSEAAMQVTQQSADIVDQLSQLASSFDQEAQQKDSDAKELRVMMLQLDRDIAKTESGIRECLTTALGRSYSGEVEEGIAEVRKQNAALEAQRKLKLQRLRNMVERSQVAELEVPNVEGVGEIDDEVVSLLISLSASQLVRKKLVDDLVQSYLDTSKNTATINSYRRLVSHLSSVPLADVDESLDDIEECLKNDA